MSFQKVQALLKNSAILDLHAVDTPFRIYGKNKSVLSGALFCFYGKMTHKELDTFSSIFVQCPFLESVQVYRNHQEEALFSEKILETMRRRGIACAEHNVNFYDAFRV